MCGIVGALSLNKSSINIDYTKPMADKIAHRGPDDAGYLYFHTGSKHKKNISFYHNLTDEKFNNTHSKIPTIESNLIQRKLHQHEHLSTGITHNSG